MEEMELTQLHLLLWLYVHAGEPLQLIRAQIKPSRKGRRAEVNHNMDRAECSLEPLRICLMSSDQPVKMSNKQ